MNIYSWLKDHALSRPGKAALRYRDTVISYAELAELTGSLATALKGAGIGRGDHVTIVLPNIPEFVISYMAVVGIGAVAVPVNPSFTSRELSHVLKDSESRALIMEAPKAGTYESIRSQHPLSTVITAGEGGNFSEWTSGPGRDVMEDMDPDDVAVMIYTAGLTGYPMGAMLTQRNLDHNSNLMHLCANADHTDTSLTIIPCFHSFSASVNMLAMLRYGGTVHLLKGLDFKELNTILSQGAITTVCAVPTLFFALTQHPDLQGIDYTKMRVLIAGGSALPREIYDEFKERFGADIRQGYGITEASPVCAFNDIHNPIKPESIGKPVPGVTARIVDDHGRDLGTGEHGEILFKGPNVMKGYYRREKETAEILRDGWLFTGDLGYLDEDGYLYITGYKKEMVITSGFNVYNKEVENVLNSIPGVKDCVITGIPDLVRGAIIKAFVVTEDPALTEAEVKKLARRMLASYKTPRKVVFVLEIPRDEKGKALIERIESDQ